MLASGVFKRAGLKEQGRGVGRCGVHLSPRIHQEHTFGHGNACRTPAEIGQEYLTSGKEYIDPCRLGRMRELGGKQEWK